MSRLTTLADLLRHFLARQKFFFIPLLLVLLVAGALLLLTGGLSYVAPFVYTLF
jgi:hypothetical protein